MQENSSKTFLGRCFKVEIMSLQQFLNGMLCFHAYSGDTLYNPRKVKSACCNVVVP